MPRRGQQPAPVTPEAPAPPPRSSHGEDLLLLASDPAATLETLLSALVDRAVQLSGSDAGGAVFLSEGRGGAGGSPAAVVGGVVPERALPVLRAWAGDAPAPGTCSILGPGAAGGALTATGRSLLLAPLAENRQTFGALLLESLQSDFYGERQRELIESLALEGAVAVRRLVARERLARSGFDLDLVGVSAAFLDLERQAKHAAACPRATVLIVGERGTGKELTARAIHAWSERRDEPFVAVLASALTDNLACDELYGHEAHSFTGAERLREGKFQSAHRGTLFLDEVGDMPPAVQSSLLRVVERGEIQRLGRDRPMKVDVRILAATNRDLEGMMERGEFRSDLFDRLAIFQVRVPPLRERREDIPFLARYFLRKHCRQMHRTAGCRDHEGGTCAWSRSLCCMSDDFTAALVEYDWPGNVRELSNIMLRLAATVDDPVLEPAHLPPPIAGRFRKASRPPAADDLTLDGAVRRHIERVLALSGQRQSEAARRLGLPYSTLQSKMRRLGIRARRHDIA